MYLSYQEAVGIDGEPIEFESIFSQDFRHWEFFTRSKKLKRKNIKPEEFTDRIIFMSMCNDIDWSKRGNDGTCISSASKGNAMKFLQGHWTFSGPGSEKKWYGGSPHPPKGERDSTANEMVQRFKETGHLVFKSTSALSRGILKRKKQFETIHFNGDSSDTELLFRTIHFGNQLSIYGAVANWCQQFGSTEEEKGRDNLSMIISFVTSASPDEAQLRHINTLQEKYLELRSIVQQNSVLKIL